jgi:hypothetical protein
MVQKWQSPATRYWARALVLCAAAMTAGCSYLPWFASKPAPPPPMPKPIAVPEAMPEASVEAPELTKPATEAPPGRPASARPRVASRRPPPAKDTKAPPVEESPAVAPAELVGSDYAAVLKVLRRPDSVDTSALSVVWSYRDSDCQLKLFFYPDIETTTFHVLRYDLQNAAGEKLANTNPCMQQFMAARTDGTLSR